MMTALSLTAALPLPGFLSSPLYAGLTAALLAGGAAIAFFKAEQPLIALVLAGGAGYIGYVMFATIGN